MLLDHFRALPDRNVSRTRYRELAQGYDATCGHITGVREVAIAALALRPGETVFDVACGTGATLPVLAWAVGVNGRVIGIEHSPEMLAIAHRRIGAQRLDADVRLIEAAVEDADIECTADAILFCYTHDVLQSPRALQRLFLRVKPAARVVAVGVRLLPWWAAPANLWTCYRTRKYLTTYKGLRQPWRPLQVYCPNLRVVRTFHVGTSYMARGIFEPRATVADGAARLETVAPGSPCALTPAAAFRMLSA